MKEKLQVTKLFEFLMYDAVSSLYEDFKLIKEVYWNQQIKFVYYGNYVFDC